MKQTLIGNTSSSVVRSEAYRMEITTILSVMTGAAMAGTPEPSITQNKIGGFVGGFGLVASTLRWQF